MIWITRFKINQDDVNQRKSNMTGMSCGLCWRDLWLPQAPARKAKIRMSLGEELRGQSCWRQGSFSQHTCQGDLSTDNWQKFFLSALILTDFNHTAVSSWKDNTALSRQSRSTLHCTMIISSYECWGGQPQFTLDLTLMPVVNVVTASAWT